MTPADSAANASISEPTNASAALRDLPFDEIELGARVAESFAQAAHSR